jgi:hypothetical protein
LIVGNAKKDRFLIAKLPGRAAYTRHVRHRIGSFLARGDGAGVDRCPSERRPETRMLCIDCAERPQSHF